ncbi:MAG: hypothetical protein WDW38_003286 [Sanguina aurantia]
MEAPFCVVRDLHRPGPLFYQSAPAQPPSSHAPTCQSGQSSRTPPVAAPPPTSSCAHPPGPLPAHMAWTRPPNIVDTGALRPQTTTATVTTNTPPTAPAAVREQLAAHLATAQTPASATNKTTTAAAPTPFTPTTSVGIGPPTSLQASHRTAAVVATASTTSAPGGLAAAVSPFVGVLSPRGSRLTSGTVSGVQASGHSSPSATYPRTGPGEALPARAVSLSAQRQQQAASPEVMPRTQELAQGGAAAVTEQSCSTSYASPRGGRPPTAPCGPAPPGAKSSFWQLGQKGRGMGQEGRPDGEAVRQAGNAAGLQWATSCEGMSGARRAARPHSAQPLSTFRGFGDRSSGHRPPPQQTHALPRVAPAGGVAASARPRTSSGGGRPQPSHAWSGAGAAEYSTSAMQAVAQYYAMQQAASAAYFGSVAGKATAAAAAVFATAPHPAAGAGADVLTRAATGDHTGPAAVALAIPAAATAAVARPGTALPAVPLLRDTQPTNPTAALLDAIPAAGLLSPPSPATFPRNITATNVTDVHTAAPAPTAGAAILAHLPITTSDVLHQRAAARTAALPPAGPLPPPPSLPAPTQHAPHPKQQAPSHPGAPPPDTLNPTVAARPSVPPSSEAWVGVSAGGRVPTEAGGPGVSATGVLDGNAAAVFAATASPYANGSGLAGSPRTRPSSAGGRALRPALSAPSSSLSRASPGSSNTVTPPPFRSGAVTAIPPVTSSAFRPMSSNAMPPGSAGAAGRTTLGDKPAGSARTMEGSYELWQADEARLLPVFTIDRRTRWGAGASRCTPHHKETERVLASPLSAASPPSPTVRGHGMLGGITSLAGRKYYETPLKDYAGAIAAAHTAIPCPWEVSMPSNGPLDCWDLSIPEPAPAARSLVFTPRRRAQQVKDVAPAATNGGPIGSDDSPRDNCDASSTHAHRASTARQRPSSSSLLPGSTPRSSSPAWTSQGQDGNGQPLDSDPKSAEGVLRPNSDLGSPHVRCSSARGSGGGGEEQGRGVSSSPGGGGQESGSGRGGGGGGPVGSRQQRHALGKSNLSARHIAKPPIMELTPEFKGRLAAARCKVHTGARVLIALEQRGVAAVGSSGGDSSSGSGSDQDDSRSGESSDEGHSSG